MPTALYDVKAYHFRDRSYKAPYDFSGYLSHDEIAKIELSYGNLICVTLANKGSVPADEYYILEKEGKINAGF